MNLFGREMHDERMLWLARAMENLPADSADLERVVRSSLGSWHARSRLMERSVSHGGEIHDVAFSPDGHRLATAGQDHAVVKSHQAGCFESSTTHRLTY